METGRILEGQLQSEWTGDTNEDTKAATFALEHVVERKGAGDDQWFGDEMLKVRSALIQHTEDLDKPMNEDATYIALHFAVYDKEICCKGRLLGHLLKR